MQEIELKEDHSKDDKTKEKSIPTWIKIGAIGGWLIIVCSFINFIVIHLNRKR